MANGYHFRAGRWELGKRTTTASTAIAVADAVALSSGALVVLTTGVKNEGISLGTKALTSAATTAIQILKCYPGNTKFLATTKANNLAATDTGGYAPLSGTTGAMGIDATPASSGDWYIDRVLSTGTSGNALVIPNDPGTLNALD